MFNKLSKSMKIVLGIGGALLFLFIGIAIASPSATPTTNSGFSPATPVPTYTLPEPAPAPEPVVPVAAPAPLAPAKIITEREWALIAKDPSAHVGNRVIVYGKVTQFDAATGAATFRSDIGAKKLVPQYGFVNYPTNTYLTGEQSLLTEVVQGDLIQIEATVDGARSYTTTLGGAITVPQLTVTKLNVIGHL